MRSPIQLPDTVRNPVSLAGMVVTTTTAVLFLALLVLEAAGAIANPYLGLLVFVTLPVVFVAGLLLIPAGAWWIGRRRLRVHRIVRWLRRPLRRRCVRRRATIRRRLVGDVGDVDDARRVG